VARHSDVDRAEVRLWDHTGDLHLRVLDRGRGFDSAKLGNGSTTGLSGMQERAEVLGGELVVESAPGRGTCLCARLPLKR
jgi:two-component system, NarL family, sensor histidine kinase UhpB